MSFINIIYLFDILVIKTTWISSEYSEIKRKFTDKNYVAKRKMSIIKRRCRHCRQVIINSSSIYMYNIKNIHIHRSMLLHPLTEIYHILKYKKNPLLSCFSLQASFGLLLNTFIKSKLLKICGNESRSVILFYL